MEGTICDGVNSNTVLGGRPSGHGMHCQRNGGGGMSELGFLGWVFWMMNTIIPRQISPVLLLNDIKKHIEIKIKIINTRCAYLSTTYFTATGVKLWDCW